MEEAGSNGSERSDGDRVGTNCPINHTTTVAKHPEIQNTSIRRSQTLPIISLSSTVHVAKELIRREIKK
ncbi:hypothetical protein OsJ_04015 [Oryza sativa Japonica Group]|uniref:Uncharacterized protein n=1 Tax=Oryza sativa subsp. japonica TaxID=39947 RepID=B9EUC4_ORYSJ|nr:hypothetical protein OsJ_04015 [Oryza sativa Japonica Group]